MTTDEKLTDEFAGIAMGALIQLPLPPHEAARAAIANTAYDIAEAMMHERHIRDLANGIRRKKRFPLTASHPIDKLPPQ